MTPQRHMLAIARGRPRHPPNEVMSRCAVHGVRLAQEAEDRPSRRRAPPTRSRAAREPAARTRRGRGASSSHTSTSIAAPPDGSRTIPGRAGVVPRSKQPVGGRRRRRRHEPRAEVEQLVVERLARQVRAHDRQSGAAAGRSSRVLAHHCCREREQRGARRVRVRRVTRRTAARWPACPPAPRPRRGRAG